MSIATVAVLATAGVYLVTIGQLMDTKNIRSAVFFKVLPTLIGVVCLLVAVKMLGWL